MKTTPQYAPFQQITRTSRTLPRTLELPALMATLANSCALARCSRRPSFIYGRQSCDTRSMEDSQTDIDQGNAKFGGQEATVIFDRVFVPNEHIFMNGEVEFASELCVVAFHLLLSTLSSLSLTHTISRALLYHTHISPL